MPPGAHAGFLLYTFCEGVEWVQLSKDKLIILCTKIIDIGPDLLKLLPPPKRLCNAMLLSVYLFVCLSVSLSVCLLATLRKNY